MTDLEKLLNMSASEVLEYITERYVMPMEEKTEAMRNALLDPNRRWEGNSKAIAKAKYQAADTRLIDFKAIVRILNEVVENDKKIISSLSHIYNKWVTDISVDGRQPSEMLEMQSEILQELFNSIQSIVKGNEKRFDIT